MPYIKPEDRKVDHYALSCAAEEVKKQGPGFANYVISTFLYNAYDILSAPSYKKYNEAMGVLAAASAEMARRFANYEQGKLEENGDVVKLPPPIKGLSNISYGECGCGYCTGGK